MKNEKIRGKNKILVKTSFEAPEIGSLIENLQEEVNGLEKRRKRKDPRWKPPLRRLGKPTSWKPHWGLVELEEKKKKEEKKERKKYVFHVSLWWMHVLSNICNEQKQVGTKEKKK